MNFPSIKRQLRSSLVWVLTVLLAAQAYGQSFRSFGYNEFDGLLYSDVTDVDFGSDGRIWFATRAGVAAFDGVHWEVQSKAQGFPLTSGALHIEFSRAGGLWVTTASLAEGLAKWEHGNWSRFRPAFSTEFASRIIEFKFAPYRAGEQLHALLSDGTLLRLIDNEWKTASIGVHSMQAIPNGLLLATERGLEELDRTGNSRSVPSSPSHSVLAVHREFTTPNSSQTWLIDADGLGLLKHGKYERVIDNPGWFDLRLEERISMQSDGLGGLYFGNTQDVFLWSDDNLRSLKTAAGSAPEGTRGIALDSNHNIWLATKHGAHRIPPRVWEYYGQENGLYDDEVSALLAMPSGGMVAGHDAGLTFIEDFNQEHWRTLRLLPEANYVGRVLDLEPDGEGGFWIAADKFGAAHVDKSNQLTWLRDEKFATKPTVEDRYRSIAGFAHDQDGNLWMVSNDRVARDSGSGFVNVPVPFAPTFLRRIVEGPEGALFACSASLGILRWKNGDWFQIQSNDPSYKNVFCVAFPEHGPPLVGTIAGLRAIENDELVAPPSHLAIDAPVFTITEDSRGWLWFGTERGIYRWDGSWLQHFTTSDGLAGLEVNRDAVLEDERGRMWFGTNGGLCRFDPTREIQYAPPVLRSIRASSRGAELLFTPAVQLKEGDWVDFDLKIASLAGSGNPEYQFRIARPSEDWSTPEPAKFAHLYFSNLPAGEFQIEIQTRNAGGPWGQTIALPAIHVRPALWNTWWFRLGSALLGAGFVAGVTVLFFRSRQAFQLGKQLAIRTKTLRETELRFERLFALNPSGQILVHPENGLIQQANQSACALLGKNAVDVPNSSLVGCLSGIELELDSDQFDEAFRSSSGETSFDLVRSPSCERRLDLHVRVARFPFGEGQLALVTMTDVTEKHVLAEELRQTQSLRAIGQLAGGLAHDFNNLLTTILGHVDLLDVEKVSAEQLPERLDEIRIAGQRGADLVRKLLAFGRQQLLQPEVIALGPTVARVVEPLNDVLGERVRVECDFDRGAGYVLADRAEIDRAVLNLCLNAREAMPRGGTVRVAVRQATHEEIANLNRAADAPENWLLLSVTDEGIGMSPEVRTRLFEPFFTTKQNTGGAGLGLSTVHGIVSQSGGLMEVRSIEGQGTEMRIFLPAVSSDLTPPALPSTPLPSPPPSLNILLVDDQPEVRSTISKLLKGMGSRVREAENGIEALEIWKASTEPFDLVLTDVMMPGMDGVELGQELQRLRPGQPMLYMSGYLDQAAKRVEGSFLGKPFSRLQLQEALLAACPFQIPTRTPPGA